MNGCSKIFTESALQCARLIKSQQQTVNFDFDKCSLRGNKENSAINSYVPHANGDIKKVQRNFRRGRKRVASADSFPVRAAGQNILFPNASFALAPVRIHLFGGRFVIWRGFPAPSAEIHLRRAGKEPRVGGHRVDGWRAMTHTRFANPAREHNRTDDVRRWWKYTRAAI